MPDAPRRRLTRRTAPPRPTFEVAAGASTGIGTPTRQNIEGRRVVQQTARQVPYLVVELKRVAGVTAVCLGLLAVLTVVDRMR